MAEKSKNQFLKEDLKIDPVLLAFDVDGVCADTMGLFLDILRDEYRIDIIATGSFEAKTEILINKNKSYFVEDRLDTCYSLSSAGITSLVFKQPWNQEQHPFIEVRDWDDLKNLIAF